MQKIKQYTKRLLISLTPEQYKLLRDKAYITKVSIAEVLRQLIDVKNNAT